MMVAFGNAGSRRPATVAEKLLPWRRAATTFVTVALLVLGLAVAFAPERVLGLLPPDGAMNGSATAEMS